MLANRLEAIAGIQLHGLEPCRSMSGGCRRFVSGSLVHQATLGTLVGSLEFVSNLIEERLDEERKLWQVISWVPDLQCAWRATP